MGNWLYVVVVGTGFLSVDVKLQPMTEAQCRALVQLDTDQRVRRAACIAPDGRWVPGPLGGEKK